MKKLTYSIAAIAAAIMFIFFSSLFGGGVATVHAAASAITFDETDVLDDLQTATINGRPFNVIDYPYDSTGIVKHPEILTVAEYCYSVRPAERDNYGVYIYFYNPQGLNFKTDSGANKITLGIKYSEDGDGNLKVDDYEKFTLKFCSKSTGDYRDLFYKFKVMDHKSSDGKTIAERVVADSNKLNRLSNAHVLEAVKKKKVNVYNSYDSSVRWAEMKHIKPTRDTQYCDFEELKAAKNNRPK